MSTFGSDTGLFAPDPKFPVAGSGLNSQYIRSVLGNIQTHLRNTTYFGAEPSVPAQVLGDIYSFPVNLINNYNLNITINGNNQTVDCRGSTPSATTLDEIVNKINTAYTAVGTVAYNVGGYLLIRSRIGGPSTSVTISNASSNDAKEIILGLGRRGVTYPVTYTGSDLPEGTFWGTGTDLQNINYKSARAATVLGRRSVTSDVNLSVNRFLSVTIKGVTLSIDLTSETQASTTAVPRTDIIEAINVACQDQFNDSFEYASLSGSFFKLTTNDTNPIVINYSNLGNAAPAIFGFPEDRKFYPRVFSSQSSNLAFIRGANSGGAIGTWGLPVDTTAELPTTAVIDQEMRFVRERGICYVYNAPNASWSPVIPQNNIPFDNPESTGSLRLFHTNRGIGQGSRIQPSYPIVLDNPFTASRPTARIGYIPILIPAAHPSVPNVTYSGVNHFRGNTHYDKFTRSNTSAGVVGQTPTSLTWTSTKSKSKILNNKLTYAGSDYTALDIVTLPTITNGGTPINEYTVMAKLGKASSTNSGTEAQAGFAFYLNSTTNPSSGYAIFVTDTGLLKFHRITTNGALVTPAIQIVQLQRPLGIDPNDLGNLRVTKFTSGVFFATWRGSDDSSDWETEDLRGDKSILLVDGGANSPTESNTMGLYLNPGSSSKTIVVDDFYYQPVINEYPALPPVSGQRLRDIITSVRISGQTQIINDSSPTNPLVINNGPGILLSQNTADRIITISADTGNLLTRTQHNTVDHTNVFQVFNSVLTFTEANGYNIGQSGGPNGNRGFTFNTPYEPTKYDYIASVFPLGYIFNPSTATFTGSEAFVTPGVAFAGDGSSTVVTTTIRTSAVRFSAIQCTLYKIRKAI
jgi:hypothetical protein